MSTKTTNFEFIKPEKTDPADITATNENWDKIDADLLKAKRCYRNLNDIGITSYSTTFRDILTKMPNNSILILDLAACFRNDSTGETWGQITTVVTDWNLDVSHGVCLIIKGATPRLSMFCSQRRDYDSDDNGKNKAFVGTFYSDGGNRVLWSEITERAPQYTYSTTDLTVGTSKLATGKLYIVYE